MDIRQLSQIMQAATQKKTQVQQVGDCPACSTNYLPLGEEEGSSFLSKIPWKCIAPTFVITAGLVGYLTWKLAKSATISKLALKVSGLGEKRRVRRRKRRRKR